jgi:hypothetical protein
MTHKSEIKSRHGGKSATAQASRGVVWDERGQDQPADKKAAQSAGLLAQKRAVDPVHGRV